MTQIKTLYSLIPKTDLHVGAGSEMAGIIDNLVQRNSTTGFPCINNSSLKGAIKQHASKNSMSSDDMKKIFGSDVVRNNNTDTQRNADKEDDSQQGNTAFGQAEFLALAVPSDKTMFILVTSSEVLELFLDNLEDYGIAQPHLTSLLTKIKADGSILSSQIEGGILPLNKKVGNNKIVLSDEEKAIAKNLFGKYYTHLALISNEDFIELASDFYLPVAAHNAIIDGKSDNLFYTQNIPMLSVFYFINVYENTTDEQNLATYFVDKLVHIGANYSTSQGFCKITKI